MMKQVANQREHSVLGEGLSVKNVQLADDLNGVFADGCYAVDGVFAENREKTGVGNIMSQLL